MKKLILFSAIFLTSVTAFAAQNSLSKSVREIKDIISSSELRRYLPANERILDIRRVDRGYLITTNHFQLYVEVLYPKRAGKEGEESEKEGEGKIQFSQPTQITQ